MTLLCGPHLHAQLLGGPRRDDLRPHQAGQLREGRGRFAHLDLARVSGKPSFPEV